MSPDPTPDSYLFTQGLICRRESFPLRFQRSQDLKFNPGYQGPPLLYAFIQRVNMSTRIVGHSKENMCPEVLRQITVIMDG